MRYNVDLVKFLIQDKRFLRHDVDRTEIDTRQKIASELCADTTALSKWSYDQPSLDNFVALYELGKDYFRTLPLWVASDGNEVLYRVPEVDFQRPVFLDKGYVPKALSETSTSIGDVNGKLDISTLGTVYLATQVPMFLPEWPEYFVLKPEPRDSHRIAMGSSYNLDEDLNIMRITSPKLKVITTWRGDPRTENEIYAFLSQYITSTEKGDYVSDVDAFRRQVEALTQIQPSTKR